MNFIFIIAEANNDDNPIFDHFLGFDEDEDSDKWSVFVKVVVNLLERYKIT